ncbi:MAG: hypothetical protein JO118_13575, partial [Acetobacteraceae bacterium]|nr:hypothetical protein [Acetobacteraceae bacterium]
IWAAVVLLVHHLVVYSASSLFQDMFFMNGQALTVVAFGAFLGGVVSIANKVGNYLRSRSARLVNSGRS